MFVSVVCFFLMQNIIGNWDVEGCQGDGTFPTCHQMLGVSCSSSATWTPCLDASSPTLKGPGLLLSLTVLLPVGGKALREAANREEGP